MGKCGKGTSTKGHELVRLSNLPLLKNRSEYKDILGTDGQWKEGDFLIQWPSTDLEYRIKVAKETHNKLFGDPDAQQS